jgi:hypothetical protein
MDLVWSVELQAELQELTPKQQRAIPRIVEALASGRTLTSLLQGPGKICAWKTYYQRPRGWHHQARFQRVLAQAQAEYRQALMLRVVDEAAEDLRLLTRPAVQLAGAVLQAVISGQVEGDVPAPVEVLLQLMRGEGADCVEVQQRRLAADSLLSKGLAAAFQLLDRADIKTAVKSTGGDAQRWADLLQELRDVGDEDGEVADAEAEAGRVPAPELQPAPGPDAGSREPSAGDPGGRGGAVGQE